MIVKKRNIQKERNQARDYYLNKEGIVRVWWPTKLTNGEIALFGEKVFRKFEKLDYITLFPIYSYEKI